MVTLRTALMSLLVLFVLIYARPSAAAIEVKVFGYHFPPFVDDYGGVSPKLVDILNQFQTKYRFTFTKTAPGRRYRDLQTGRGDLIFFEMPKWGWHKTPVQFETTREILSGQEVYLALAKPDRDQTFFNDIHQKRLAVISGYHYGFADFNANKTWLKNNYKITLTKSHTNNIRILRADRVDISIINMSYLRKFFKENEYLRAKILVSDAHDQKYQLKSIVRKGSPIQANELEQLLEGVKKSGRMAQLLDFYGIADQLSF